VELDELSHAGTPCGGDPRWRTTVREIALERDELAALAADRIGPHEARAIVGRVRDELREQRVEAHALTVATKRRYAALRGKDAQRAGRAARDLLLALRRGATDRAHEQLAAIDPDLRHLDVPLLLVAEQRAVERGDPRTDEHHTSGDLVARVRIAGRGEREAIAVGDHHRLHAAVLAALIELVPEGLGGRIGPANTAFLAHP